MRLCIKKSAEYFAEFLLRRSLRVPQEPKFGHQGPRHHQIDERVKDLNKDGHTFAIAGKNVIEQRHEVPIPSAVTSAKLRMTALLPPERNRNGTAPAIVVMVVESMTGSLFRRFRYVARMIPKNALIHPR